MSLRPKKILHIKPSKYESAEAIHTNKKYWQNIFNVMDKGREEVISEQEIEVLSDALPDDLFKKVCGILNMSAPKKDLVAHIKTEESRRTIRKHPFLSKRKTFIVDRELDSDTDVETCSMADDDGINIHQEFLRKPVREQIKWATRYLRPEQEHEKTLVKKADDLTNRIANEFCDYMKDLGGDQQSQLFTPKTIKELFQIEFDTHAARSLKVVPKELPSIDDRIANVTGNKEKSRYAALDREISKDIKAERRANYIKCFERSIPLREQWRAPSNDTKNQWKSARHVPKDLVTLKTVWEGITNLKSVKEYCRWMIEHPEYRRAPYLSSLGMFDRAVLDARLTVELNDTNPNIDVPAPIEHIRKRLSDLMEPN